MVAKKIRSYNYYLIEKWECEYKKECLENESMSQFIQETKLEMQEPLNLRNAFFGGRTGNTAKVYDTHGNQKIKYFIHTYVNEVNTLLVIQKYMLAKKSVFNSLAI